MQLGQLHHALIVIDEVLDDPLGLDIPLVGDEVIHIAHLHLGDDALVKSLGGRHRTSGCHLRLGDGHVVLEMRQRDVDGQWIHAVRWSLGV